MIVTPEKNIKTPAGLKKSRRGVRHKKNPFVTNAVANATIGTKRISNKKGDRLMIVSEETGEVMAPAGFHQIVEVDRTQFVKLFKNGVKAFTNLTNAGAKVFSVLYDELQKKSAQDIVYLSFADVNQEVEPMASATFYRGMKELLEHQFLAETETIGKYFVNPDYLWNGNRLAFIKEYRVKDPKAKPKDTATLDLPFDKEEKNDNDA